MFLGVPFDPQLKMSKYYNRFNTWHVAIEM